MHSQLIIINNFCLILFSSALSYTTYLQDAFDNMVLQKIDWHDYDKIAADKARTGKDDDDHDVTKLIFLIIIYIKVTVQTA